LRQIIAFAAGPRRAGGDFFAQHALVMHDSAHHDGSQHGGMVVDGNDSGVLFAG
jgi:hypothetical protein